VTISLRHVWHWGRKASSIFRSKYRNTRGLDVYIPLLDRHVEGGLLREVKDILDELNIMVGILRRQHELITQLRRHVETIMDPEMLWRDTLDAGAFAPQPDGIPWNQDDSALEELKRKDLEGRAEMQGERLRRKKELDWFRVQSADLLLGVQARIREVSDLQDSARSTEESVRPHQPSNNEESNIANNELGRLLICLP